MLPELRERVAEREPAVAAERSPKDDQALAEGGPQRIQNLDPAGGVFFTHGFRGEAGGVVGAADPGGHAHIEHVFSLRKGLLEKILIFLRGY